MRVTFQITILSWQIDIDGGSKDELCWSTDQFVNLFIAPTSWWPIFVTNKRQLSAIRSTMSLMTKTGFKLYVLRVCDAAFSNASPTVASIQPVTTTRATYVNRYSCVDQSPLCQPSLCSKWSSAQTQCRKTCHPDCKVYTTKAKPIRTTRPPRVKTTRPPKVAKLGFWINKKWSGCQPIKSLLDQHFESPYKGIIEQSPCQDNQMYGSYCSKGILDCKSLVGQMYCMRSCGKCAHIDQMFVCKDERPEFCGMINCANPLGIQLKITISNVLAVPDARSWVKMKIDGHFSRSGRSLIRRTLAQEKPKTAKSQYVLCKNMQFLS